jgi:voltage-gated potassium channel
MGEKLKNTVYRILESTTGDRGIGRKVAFAFILVILINVVFAILETEPDLFERYGRLFDIVAIVSILLFSAEYVLRLWSCSVEPKYQGVFGHIRYMLTPMAIIDLISIAPFYFLVFGWDIRIVMIIRFSRIIWMLKLGRYSKAVRMFGRVIRSKKEELFVAYFILFVLLIFLSSLLFVAEHQAQPDKFASILSSLWCGIMTITTVGYGDLYPVTPFGKVIAGLLACSGIALIALPAGIFTSGLVAEMNRSRNEDGQTCPHCGKPIGKELSGSGEKNEQE